MTNKITAADAESWVTPDIFLYKKKYYEIKPNFDVVEVNIICPECGKKCPDDDRVKQGMKCRFCAY